MPKGAQKPVDYEAISEACLNFLIANPEELSRFMDHAGLAPDSLRASLGTSALALGALDYVVHNESVMLAVAANAGVAPERVMRLWGQLNREQ
jgi:hypothetical protein